MSRKDPEADRAYRRAYARTHPRQRDKEAKRVYDRARYLANPDAVIARSNAWIENNRERLNARLLKRYHALKHMPAYHARLLEYKRARRAKPGVLERERAQDRARHAADPAKHQLKAETRRARIAQAPISDLTRAEWEEIKAAYGYRCVYCETKPAKLTMDHITPLAKGGSHTKSNVVPACKSCNSKKQDRGVLKPIQPLLL